MRVVETPEALKALIGQELGVGEWLEVTQEMIDRFADVTGDHQWIHVDVERAKKEMPGGKTIAHGYLTLSLLPKLNQGIFKVTRRKRGVNYGSNKVRFTAPVPVNSRLRAQLSLQAFQWLDGGACQMVWGVTMECEGQPKPVCVAEAVVRLYP